ncbi:MAG: O-antigen ligase family protein [Chloroflexi bacterium]|nr:O-antigen ligase family protein [Chloroflexota bacterium]
MVWGFAVIGVLSATWLFKVPGISAILQALPSQILQLPGSDSGVQPNPLAGTLLLYLPFLVSLLLGWRPAAHRRWLLAGTAVLTLITAALLILTQSRSGWIGAIGGLFVLLVLWGIVLPSMRQRKLIWAGVGASLLAGIGGLWAFGPQKLQTIGMIQVNWGHGRWQSWFSRFSARSVALGHHGRARFSFTGAGLGAFRHVVRRLYPLNVNPTYDIAHAHNIFLQTALDVGLPGLIVYLALLLLAFWLGWQVARGDETLRPFALGLLAGFAALHIYGLTDALALGSKTGLSFWVALGLLTAMQIVRQTAVTQPHLLFQMRQRLPQIIQRPIQPLCSRFIRVNVNRVG